MSRSRLFVRASLASVLVLLAACASGGKPVAKAEEVAPVIVTIEAPMATAQKDALGSYRFEMQQGEQRMSADQFDAWMKANGIRVARGKGGASSDSGARREGACRRLPCVHRFSP